jgi:kynurenine 3-monooxygenase
MDLAEKNGVKFIYNERCTHVDLENTVSYFENHDSKKITEIKSDRIFATDGAFSAGRAQLQTSTDRFNYQQFYLEHGYKELCIQPLITGEFAMEKNALHIWPRGQFMLIALPNIDKTFTCTLFFPFEGEKSFASLNTKEKMMDFFLQTFPDVIPLMPTLADDYMANPVSSLVTVKCTPWTYKDKLALVGDAAHAIVPFFGQGMNCGFEDCVVLNELMDKHCENWNSIFEEYQLLRKPDGDAIADLAIGNFIEMRDRVADPKFLLQKKIEASFTKKHPDKWKPLYTMVTYSPDIRYSTALKEGTRQENIMKEIMAMPGIETKWDSAEIEQEILKRV